MTQLTEHAKKILQAVVNGKEIERKAFDDSGEWYEIPHSEALKYALNRYGELRIKPEVRSINGVEFAAPVEDGYRVHIQAGDSNKFVYFAETNDRDTAYQAIVDALEGKNHG